MPISIQVPENMFQAVEKRLKYRFWDKERERSQRAAGLADKGPVVPLCPRNHDTIAWSGPPHNKVRCYTCLHCNVYISEPEIRDKGLEFETIADWQMHQMMDEKLTQFRNGSPKLFVARR